MSVDIRRPLKKLLPFLLQAQKDNLNEANTVLRLVKMFEDVLGWDGMSEISRESPLKNKYVDIVLKKDGVIKLLVEAKAAGDKLRDRYVEQAELYASENNYHWVVLSERGRLEPLPPHLRRGHRLREGLLARSGRRGSIRRERRSASALLHSQAFKKE